MYKVTSRNILALMETHRISIVPVLGHKGIDFWQAGTRQRSSSGLNFVAAHRFAQGASALEAVRNLLNGKTVFKKTKTGLKKQ